MPLLSRVVACSAWQWEHYNRRSASRPQLVVDPRPVQSSSIAALRLQIGSLLPRGRATAMTTSSPNSGLQQVPEVRRLGREPGLDGLRAVAVLIVFASHVEAFLPLATLLVVPGGTVGLDPFFILSGFLITALLLKEQSQYGTIMRWNFYKRRAVRLLPPLFFLLIANVAIAVALNAWSRQELNSLLSVTFYYSNYYQASSKSLFCSNLSPGYEHLWSLSFEEQFYLVWPWIVIFFLTIKRSLRTVTIVILGTIAVIGIHRGLGYYGPQSWCYEFHATQDRADALLWGCLAAHLWVRGPGTDETDPDSHLAGGAHFARMPAVHGPDWPVPVQRWFRPYRPVVGDRPARCPGGNVVRPPNFRVETTRQTGPDRLRVLFVARNHLRRNRPNRHRVELRTASAGRLQLDAHDGADFVVPSRTTPSALGASDDTAVTKSDFTGGGDEFAARCRRFQTAGGRVLERATAGAGDDHRGALRSLFGALRARGVTSLSASSIDPDEVTKVLFRYGRLPTTKGLVEVVGVVPAVMVRAQHGWWSAEMNADGR